MAIGAGDIATPILGALGLTWAVTTHFLKRRDGKLKSLEAEERRVEELKFKVIEETGLALKELICIVQNCKVSYEVSMDPKERPEVVPPLPVRPRVTRHIPSQCEIFILLKEVESSALAVWKNAEERWNHAGSTLELVDTDDQSESLVSKFDESVDAILLHIGESESSE